MALSSHDKTVLERIGRGAYGQELVQILEKIRNEKLSLDSIRVGQEYGPQVEGRLIFKEFVDEFVAALSHRQRTVKALDADDYS